jgi:uncharacterized membrane protein YtjA (UPF0391 family)
VPLAKKCRYCDIGNDNGVASLSLATATLGSPRNLETQMLRWALIFLVVALVAAVLGFGGIASGAAEIAKILFFVFLALLVISLVAGAFRGRRSL